MILWEILALGLFCEAVLTHEYARVYPNGRALPTASLQYVKQRFKEINPDIVWDQQNYLEVMSANFSSCNFPEGIVDGFANVPDNTSWVAFIEYQNISVTTVSEVIRNLKPVVDNWVSRKRYNTQITGARKFGCSVSPGCGNYEGRMGVSCVFSPSSPRYIPSPDEYDDIKPANEYRAESSEPLAFTGDQYLKGQLLTGKRWERGHFLENLSRLETSCAMVLSDHWEFLKHRQVLHGMDLRVFGVFGKRKIDENAELTIDGVLLDMKDQLPSNLQIGCTYLQDCDQDNKAWVVVSCLYEERCRKEVCF